MKLNLRVGDIIISAQTGKVYKVLEIGCVVKCCDLEGNGNTYLYRHMITDKNFYYA